MHKEILCALEALLKNYRASSTKEYYDSSDAVIFLGISKSTLYKLNYKKIIPFYKPANSKKVYYKREDLEKYLSENRISSNRELDERAKTLLNSKNFLNV